MIPFDQLPYGYLKSSTTKPGGKSNEWFYQKVF